MKCIITLPSFQKMICESLKIVLCEDVPDKVGAWKERKDLIVFQLVKKFHACYTTLRFITMFRSSRPYETFWDTESFNSGVLNP
jgi:hypothetical protein